MCWQNIARNQTEKQKKTILNNLTTDKKRKDWNPMQLLSSNQVNGLEIESRCGWKQNQWEAKGKEDREQEKASNESNFGLVKPSFGPSWGDGIK